LHDRQIAQQAIAVQFSYTLRRWVALTRYLDDGRHPIDNNLIENAIRPIAFGRSSRSQACSASSFGLACGCRYARRASSSGSFAACSIAYSAVFGDGGSPGLLA
jgi:hypothetical protein